MAIVMRTLPALCALLVLIGCASTVSSGVTVKPVGVTAPPETETSEEASGPTSTFRPAPLPKPGPPTTARAGSSSTPPAPTPDALKWRKCGQRIDCADLDVPLDYTNPNSGEVVTLKVKRRVASGDSLGPLLVNPGGPGVGGTVMVDQAQGYFDPKLLERFDLIAWDPRGTGGSEGVECLTDVDDFLSLDPTPDDQAERDAIVAADNLFANGCKANSARIIPFVGTESSARDMDQIRLALGVDKITYFGFSYGSRLGATYATLFPNSLRTMVIDGAEDPTANGETSNFEQIIRSEERRVGKEC